MGKAKKKEELSIPVMILCIIGVVSIVFGFLLLKNDKFKLIIFSTESTVTSTVTASSADKTETSTVVNLSYIANNSNYTATIANYDKDVKIGDKITLYYDIFSPETISQKRTGYLGYIAVILGIILTIKTGPRFLRIIKDNFL